MWGPEGLGGFKLQGVRIWEFPKIRGTLFWAPYNKDPTIWGTTLGSPYFRKLPFTVRGLGSWVWDYKLL